MNNVSKTIGWTDKSWNPITGCLNNCEYCYAKRIYQRFHRSFNPKIHYDRLSQPLKCKKLSKIFVCSVSDFWGKGVPQIWREEVYNIIKACPQHIFQILTKQPQNIEDENRIPENVWVGVSVDSGDDAHRIGKLLSIIKENITFVSYEPILGELSIKQFPDLKWLIIGGLTPTPKHLMKWIDDILIEADRYKIPVFIKHNAYHSEIRGDFPKKVERL